VLCFGIGGGESDGSLSAPFWPHAANMDVKINTIKMKATRRMAE
jgi:hypothetical protein